LVIVRAANASALPKVRKAGERSVGAVDEEAIAESDKMGESGDVAAGKSVTKTFTLPPGSYVVFCNIDTKTGTTVVNHFTHGMSATLLVV
jgi:plastocyanin